MQILLDRYTEIHNLIEMLTKEDIQQIIEAEKEIFPTKEELTLLEEGMRENFSNLLTEVDSYAKKADTYF